MFNSYKRGLVSIANLSSIDKNRSIRKEIGMKIFKYICLIAFYIILSMIMLIGVILIQYGVLNIGIIIEILSILAFLYPVISIADKSSKNITERQEVII